jgi:hypothetical protein
MTEFAIALRSGAPDEEGHGKTKVAGVMETTVRPSSAASPLFDPKLEKFTVIRIPYPLGPDPLAR